MYKHTTINIDNRCLDLLLTEEEISNAFDRSLYEENKQYINLEKCCKCWPIDKPPKCRFWSKILGMCYECDD